MYSQSFTPAELYRCATQAERRNSGFRKIEGVYYYARFVDDIIVFCSSEASKELAWEYAGEELEKIGLHLNEKKSYATIKWLINGSQLHHLRFEIQDLKVED